MTSAPTLPPSIRPKTVPSSCDVTVVVITHNYARFLDDCLRSVAQQTTPPAAVLVIDDASTDNPLPIALRHGAKYRRVEFRNVHLVRRAGLAAVTSKYVLFLDADNKLRPRFLETAIAQMEADRTVAGVFPVLAAFGEATGPRYDTDKAPVVLAGFTVEQRNWCDAGTVWRTDALRQSEALQDDVSRLCNAGDWRMARRVVRAGPWKLVRGSIPLDYRVHAQQMSRRKSSYWVDADLAHEPVTIVMALSGRWHHWPARLRWLLAQTWPDVRLLIVDSSHRGATVHSLGLSDWPGELMLLRNTVGRPGLADAQRTIPDINKAVESAVSAIYNRAVQAAQSEYLLFLEDDVFPERLDAIAALMARMDPRTAGVSGAYPHRMHPERCCAFDLPWRGKLIPWEGARQQLVSGTGFGCLLARKSILGRYPLSGDHGPNPHYDIDFAVWCTRQGLRIVLDRAVRCEHRTAALEGTPQ